MEGRFYYVPAHDEHRACGHAMLRGATIKTKTLKTQMLSEKHHQDSMWYVHFELSIDFAKSHSWLTSQWWA